jgi:hypothetical protein
LCGEEAFGGVEEALFRGVFHSNDCFNYTTDFARVKGEFLMGR